MGTGFQKLLWKKDIFLIKLPMSLQNQKKTFSRPKLEFYLKGILKYLPQKPFLI